MAQFALADNVKETTTTTGIGTVSLGGAFNASSKTFVNGIGSGKITAYKVDDGAGNWENRYGVITSGAPDTITNAGFISSSTGVAVNFLSGTKTVTCVPMPELVLTAAISPVLVETDIASATTTDLGSIQTLRARITGTNPITSFGTSPNTFRIVRFASAGLTLTYNAVSLITMTGANRITAAGDVGMYVSDASGNWLEVSYTPAAGFVEATVASGAAITFTAGSGNGQNVLSISLQAGEWDVEGMLCTQGTAPSNLQVGINSVSATQPSAHYINTGVSAAANGSLVAPRRKFSFSTTTTVYLVCSQFGAGAPTMFGYINARRVA